MKSVFVIFFLLYSNFLFGQISLENFFSYFGNNPDKIETFVSNKGFQFDGFTNGIGKLDNRDGFEFKKKNGSDSSIIRIYTYSNNENKISSISYSFINTSEFADFKNQLSKLEFQLKSSKSDVDKYFKKDTIEKHYENKGWLITLYSTYSERYGLHYQIVIEKDQF
jgi:hypothetical protein